MTEVEWINGEKLFTIQIRKVIRRNKHSDHFETRLSDIYGPIKLWVPHWALKAELPHQGDASAKIGLDLDWAISKGLASDAEVIPFNAKKRVA